MKAGMYGEADLQSILEAASGDGVAQSFHLASTIHDKQSFSDAIRSVVPLNPPIPNGPANWDALADSLFDGMLSVRGPVILRWPNHELMAASAPNDYAVAIEIFQVLIRELASETTTVGRPTKLFVVLE